MNINENIDEFKRLVLPELSRSELEERCLELFTQNQQFRFMITGLGWEDIQPMHEINSEN